MADDFYEDGDMPEASSERKAATEESETQTALLPQSLCPDMEPGDVIKVRIVEVTEQDYLVSYLDEEDSDEETEETTTETVTSSMDEMMD